MSQGKAHPVDQIDEDEAKKAQTNTDADNMAELGASPVDIQMQTKKCMNNFVESTDNESSHFCFSNTETANLEYLRKINELFIKERNWHQFHSPRNVLLALVGEVGELAEIFQWKGEVSEGLPELSEAEKDHVGEEISDVLIYLIDFASRCHVDIPKAVASKMAANALKYPADKAFGKANKYTDYE